MKHAGAVRSLVFSADGQRILSLADGVVRLWNAAEQLLLAKPFRLPEVASSFSFSPDGTILVVAGRPNEARILDALTGQSIGPALQHVGVVDSSKFGPDGRSFLTKCSIYRSGTTTVGSHSFVRLWHLPALVPDDIPRIKLWVETLTGLEADDAGIVNALNTASWLERREQLVKLGGAPEGDSGWIFDPVLYGADPTARARAWVERERWAEAEEAFADAFRARPHLRSVWIESYRYYLRAEPHKAAAAFAQALGVARKDPLLRQMMVQEMVAIDAVFDHLIERLHGDLPDLTVELLLRRADRLGRMGLLDSARTIMGRVRDMPWEEAIPPDWSLFPVELFALLGFHRQVSATLSKYRGTTDAFKANEIAWYCALSPGTPEDREAALRLAKLAVERFSIKQKHLALNTLGAALYRAGRFEEAIRRLEKGIKARNGVAEPTDWPFLAMAHHRLGHRKKALSWLTRFRSYKPSTDPNKSWHELEVRLLRSEAEAVILYDPMFPADPFSPSGLSSLR
jgi:tetratricopeptide (TPR) repeat protein